MSAVRKRSAPAAHVETPLAKTLREIETQLGARTANLDQADNNLGRLLREVQDQLRELHSTGYPVSVGLPPWGKLSWTGRRGRWRLTIIDDEECEDLLNMPRLCRTDACHALRKLVERMGFA